MKSAIVPAQVTTIEDKIAGNLNLAQLLLLTGAIFGGAGIYTIIPPGSDSSPLKLVLITVWIILLSLLAIRLKGKLLIQWAVVLLCYASRPRFHIYNKNDLYLRPVVSKAPLEEVNPEIEASTEEAMQPDIPQLSTAEKVKLESIIANPQTNFHFRTGKKGVLHVRINEVKQEGII
jgi:hypothetical protein